MCLLAATEEEIISKKRDCHTISTCKVGANAVSSRAHKHDVMPLPYDLLSILTVPQGESNQMSFKFVHLKKLRTQVTS